MPALPGIRLEPPKSWDEFEDICKSSFSIRWYNPNLSRHGRQGQVQDGVDIYGYDSFLNFVGIQCKNTVHSIKESIIIDECNKAEKFNPSITALYIATTAPRDATIQAFVRKFSEERKLVNKFPVDIVFWDDITQDLTKDVNVVKQYYPDLFGYSKPTAAQLIIEKDQSNLLMLLKKIDFSSTVENLKWDAKYVHNSILTHFENIHKVVYSPLFKLNDSSLLLAVNNLVKEWAALVTLVRQAPYRYVDHMDTLSFILPGDFARNKEEEKLYNEISEQMNTLEREIHSFCSLINTSYHEINLHQTSIEASKLY
ncbi:hypothetical protein C1N63_00335 [Pantoea ananatis]|uniref:hypothetical protein n=1 Tax=Pantoea ananas TaxID=553 RepID=UPI000D72E1DF|nr:hypothetical protein [Pantoea ananatis]AWQ17385.1 hypothetical protein C1N63_00335 [Pantoea ananatis]